ncbi:9042_t:CDS:2 [Gigaspora margarita]|uniref:9042_t:CDS:1 n=1 Tax=Gigaspora margarita TaxID=4874 RepID=A0ABN7USE1_GIGMA|nr:9042_t:CDS:2 [Gigaspora margarita]
MITGFHGPMSPLGYVLRTLLSINYVKIDYIDQTLISLFLEAYYSYNYLQVSRKFDYTNRIYCFQNDHVYVVYEKDIFPNGNHDLYIFHSTRRYYATCIGKLEMKDLSTDFTETIPPIKNDELDQRKPIFRDIKPPIFAELINNKKIKTEEEAKLELNKFAKKLMEYQHSEIKNFSSTYIFSFIINNCKLKDFVDNIKETHELVMHHSNLRL